jgi:hypothetical protein
MLVMQMDRQLLPNDFSFRGDGSLEQIMLDLLRKTAPSPGNRLAKSTRKLFGLFRRQFLNRGITRSRIERGQLPY